LGGEEERRISNIEQGISNTEVTQAEEEPFILAAANSASALHNGIGFQSVAPKFLVISLPADKW
jgi:hypothetical protein